MSFRLQRSKAVAVQEFDDRQVDFLRLFYRRDVARVMNMFAGRIWDAIF